jgi:hypothetical protein
MEKSKRECERILMEKSKNFSLVCLYFSLIRDDQVSGFVGP